MADVEKVVRLLFKGDGRDLSATTKALQRDLRNFEQSGETLAAPLDRAFGSVLKLDAAAAALGATLITLALRQSGQFQTAFDKTAAIIDTGDKNLEEFRTSLLDYARDSKSSLDSITNATFNAVSAGVDFRDVLGSLGAAERLAIAGQADLNEVLQLTAKTINTYGLDASEAERLTEIFFETNRLGITTISELSSSLGNVTPTAKLAGVNIEQLAGTVATLTASTGDTSGAITGLKALLSNIIKPTKDAQEAAAAIGVEFNTTALRTKGLQDFLIDLNTAAGGNVDTLGKLFGSTEALNVAALLGSNTNNKYVDSLDAIRNSAGNVDTALEKVSDSFAQTNQTLVNNIEATLIQVGDRLQRGYGDLAGGITGILRSLGTSIEDGAFDSLFDALDETADRLSDFLSEIAVSLPEALDRTDFDALTTAIRDSGGAISGLLDSFDPSDPQDLAEALQFVVDSFASLIQTSIGFLPVIDQVITFIVEAQKEFNKADVDTQRLVGSALALASAFITLGPIIGTVVAAFAAMEGAIGSTGPLFNLLFASISLAFSTLKATLLRVELVVVDSIGDILAALDLLTFGMIDSVGNTADAAGRLEGVIRDQLKGAEDSANESLNSIGGFFFGYGEALDKAGEKTKELGSTTDATGGKVKTWAEIVSDASAASKRLEEANFDTVAETNKLAKEMGQIKDTSEAALEPLEKYSVEVSAVGAVAKSSSEEVDKFGLELRKITAGEFKAQLEFNAVEVKAQAQVISDAFNSINNTISETTRASVSLVSALNEASNPSNRLLIIDQIRKQNEFQEIGLQQQQELLEILNERLKLQRGFLEGDNNLELAIRAPENIQGILEQFYLELLKDAKFFLTTEEGGKVITGGLL